jgi:hypothetical protein
LQALLEEGEHMTARTEADDARKAAELAWEKAALKHETGPYFARQQSLTSAANLELTARRLEALARQEEALLSIGDKP